jgi:3-oxoacyl-[acyl-carrier protein] reductase
LLSFKWCGLLMKNIAGRNAVITGAAAGIGKEICNQLAKQSANLCLIDINEQGLSETANQLRQTYPQIKVITRTCDLADLQAVTACIESVQSEWPTIDILVNNAGICFRGRTKFMTAAQWDQILSININAPAQLINALLPGMLERGEGHIVNIASIFGIVPYRRIAAYQTSKYAIIGLTESLRMELAGSGVGITAICPGFVKGTDFFKGSVDVDPRGTKEMPAWYMCTPATTIATKTLSAIRWNRGIVVFPLFWRLFWLVKRFLPGPLDLAVQVLWGRSRRRRRKRNARKKQIKP